MCPLMGIKPGAFNPKPLQIPLDQSSKPNKDHNLVWIFFLFHVKSLNFEILPTISSKGRKTYIFFQKRIMIKLAEISFFLKFSSPAIDALPLYRGGGAMSTAEWPTTQVRSQQLFSCHWIFKVYKIWLLIHLTEVHSVNIYLWLRQKTHNWKFRGSILASVKKTFYVIVCQTDVE